MTFPFINPKGICIISTENTFRFKSIGLLQISWNEHEQNLENPLHKLQALNWKGNLRYSKEWKQRALTGPNDLESRLISPLSPSTQQCPLGTYTIGKKTESSIDINTKNFITKWPTIEVQLVDQFLMFIFYILKSGFWYLPTHGILCEPYNTHCLRPVQTLLRSGIVSNFILYSQCQSLSQNVGTTWLSCLNRIKPKALTMDQSYEQAKFM